MTSPSWRTSFLFVFLWAAAGPGLWAQADSLQLVGPRDFWSLVSQRHPMARQALVLEQRARQTLRQARGAFDPKLYADQEQKSFDGKNYFTYGAGGLKWESPFALELKTEFNWSDGIFLNPERSLPEAGQGVLGLRLPLGQGLLLDERRTNLRLAEWADELNTNLANGLRNELFVAATKAYWDWAYAFYALQITEDALQISLEQFEAVREGYFQGKDPAIDTLEAFLQVQNWTLERTSASVGLAAAEAGLTAYLWTPAGTPQTLSANWRPFDPAAPADDLNADSLLAQLNATHPELLEYQVKLAQLDLERRWKAEQLKPRLDLEYNILGDGWRFGDANADLRNVLTGNYKWAVRFQFPLFLRKERAGVALADLKIAETNWELADKRRQLEAKVIAYGQMLDALESQVGLGQSIVDNYNQLLAAERVRFAAGGSSIFVLNSRQQKLLEARLKLLKFQAERHKVAAALRWAAGQFW